MKAKIKVLRHNNGILPQVREEGDWIDLYMPTPVSFGRRGDYKLVDSGISIELPKGYEAVVNPRSSTFGKYKVVLANSQGVIDNSYNGRQDVWKFPLIAERKTTIPREARICQFRIQLSQFATPWQKLKWLFTSGVKIVEVDSLKGESRGGIGSTGI